MTALVSIINKRAAVIAADSAVTIDRGDNTTIFNTANKIFRLSNNNPVGVMIYGSSAYMGIPWEVLFKLYRDKSPDKPFKTLKEYVDDFILFLRKENTVPIQILNWVTLPANFLISIIVHRRKCLNKRKRKRTMVRQKRRYEKGC